MKFLQRPHEHQDEVPIDDPTSKQSKKSKQQLREEEISAYFVKKPPAKSAATGRREAKDGRQTDAANYAVKHSLDQRRSSPSEREANIASGSIDLPQRPFLGFGSKGPSHESNTHDPTSYLTWSESAPVAQQPSPRGCFPRAGEQTTKERACNGSQQRLHPGEATTRKVKQSQKLDTTTNAQKARWIETGRTKRRGHFKIHVPADDEHPTTKHATDQSVPSIVKSLPDPRARDANSHSSRLSHRDEDSDYRTSDVLRIVEDEAFESSTRLKHPSPDQQQTRSSTPTSGLLRRAFDAVNSATANIPAQHYPIGSIKPRKMNSRHEQREFNMYDTGYTPALNAYTGNNADTEVQEATSRRALNRGAGARSAQQRQPLQPLSASIVNTVPGWQPRSQSTVSNHKKAPMEDDMLGDIEGGLSHADIAEITRQRQPPQTVSVSTMNTDSRWRAPTRPQESTAKQNIPDTRQRQPYQPISTSTLDASSRWRPPSRFDFVQMMHHQPLMPDDMQDHLRDAAQTWSPGPYTYRDDRTMQPEEGVSDQRIPEQRDHIFADPAMMLPLASLSPKFGTDLSLAGGPSSALHDAPLSNLSTDRLSGHRPSGENSENEGVHDEMDGFWRPNVLY